MKITAIRGFSDILPGEVEIWQVVEAKARQIFNAYNFSEIRIPILEKTELFQPLHRRGHGYCRKGNVYF